MTTLRILARTALAGLVLATGCARIKPDEIGVRTVNFGISEGIDARDYAPGFHLSLWPVHSWQRFPSTVQHLRFAKDGQTPWAAHDEALQITSADGDRVVVTAEVFFRIAEGQAYHVLQDSGTGDHYRDVVRGLAQDATRVLFGQLHTEAFYAPESRESVRQQAIAQLQQRLKPRGIDLVDILIESVEFDANYETLIKQKKLADQRVELEIAKSHAAEERGKVALIATETAAKVQRIEREGESDILRRTTDLNLQLGQLQADSGRYASGLKADADLYKSQKEAEGQLLLKTAEADGSRRLNAALIGEGGRNLVALQAVKNLNVPEVTFPSQGFEWFNPYEMAACLGGSTNDTLHTPAESKRP